MAIKFKWGSNFFINMEQNTVFIITCIINAILVFALITFPLFRPPNNPQHHLLFVLPAELFGELIQA